jgi:hypothetical protein
MRRPPRRSAGPRARGLVAPYPLTCSQWEGRLMCRHSSVGCDFTDDGDTGDTVLRCATAPAAPSLMPQRPSTRRQPDRRQVRFLRTPARVTRPPSGSRSRWKVASTKDKKRRRRRPPSASAAAAPTSPNTADAEASPSNRRPQHRVSGAWPSSAPGNAGSASASFASAGLRRQQASPNSFGEARRLGRPWPLRRLRLSRTPLPATSTTPTTSRPRRTEP